MATDTPARIPVTVVRALACAAGAASLLGATALPASASATTNPSPLSAGSHAGFFVHRTPHRQDAHLYTTAAPLLYQGGVVMTNATAYEVFWEPSHLQSGGIASVSAGYNTLLTRFFQDVAGHSIYTLVTQYYEVAGSVKRYVQNPATELGGAYLDTTPYPTSTCSPAETNCLSDAQVRAEIAKAMTAKGWTASLNHVFFLYTSSGEDECVLGTCAFASNGWCGIHNNVTSGGTQLLYAVMPYDIPNYCGTYQGATLEPSPNNNRTADDEISTSSHELMESITDPTGAGWYDSGGNEIGDKCDTSYTPLTWGAGKANQSWNGNFYMAQDEFNNHAGGCAQTGP